jgi:hypothetical protein
LRSLDRSDGIEMRTAFFIHDRVVLLSAPSSGN